jgi:NTF2 fold immunity protein
MRLRLWQVTGALVSLAVMPCGAPAQIMYKPQAGFVPTADVAIAIAVAVWTPIYGAKQIAAEKPYHAELLRGTWHVSGSLPPGFFGGVAEADISKEDGRVLGVTHGK